MITMSHNAGAPQILGKDTRENILSVFVELLTQGVRIICVQEACGFGYGFHRDMAKAGVTSLVVAPETLNGKRKTDRMDAFFHVCVWALFPQVQIPVDFRDNTSRRENARSA